MKRFLTLLFAVLIALPVLAQETTGSIEGVVRDNSGAVLPGVTVEATSGGTGTVTSVTDSSGQYRFPRLRPGTYSVRAALSGFRDARAASVDVSVGKTTMTNLTMSLSSVAETITVTAETPLVDVSSSATSTAITREQLDMIPSGRDFTSVVTQAAGASNEAFLGGISIDGASGAENRFVIDGIDTTHPENGTSAQDVVTDFIEEVQVKSAGYAAEFGGSLGGVINAVTRSGTNDFHGTANAYMQDRGWGGSERPEYYASSPTLYRTFDEDDDVQTEAGFTLGGPIMRDNAWFYLGYQPQWRTIDRVPDGSGSTFTQDIDQSYYLANITGNIGSQFLWKLGGNWNPYERNGILPNRDGSTPAAADLSVKREITVESYSLHMDWVPSKNFFMTGRIGSFSTETNDSGLDADTQFQFVSPTKIPLPESDPRYRPSGFLSVPSFFQTNQDLWERDSMSLDATYFLQALGQHQLKAGVQMEDISNVVNDGEVGNNFRIRWNTTRLGVRGTYGSVEVRSFATVGNADSENQAYFLQDTWQITPNFLVNFGVRTEQEKVPNYPINVPDYGPYAWTFDFGDKVAPRFGMSWDILGDQRWKAYASAGRYYDITKLAMPRGSFGADRWIAFIYPLNTLDWETLDDGCHQSTNNPADNPCPNLGTPGSVRDFRLPSNPAESIDPDLKPMQQEEWQVGLEHQLTAGSMLGFRYVNKSLIDTIEDIGYLVEDAPGEFNEHYITGNPGKGVVAGDPPGPTPGQPKAVRDYQAFELSYIRQFVDNWSVRATYTYSELEGNYSGLASSDEFGRNDPNIERYFDSLVNGYDDQGNLVVGPLNTDRPHAIEAQAAYQFPGIRTRLGVNASWRSGTPTSEEIYYTGVPYFANGRNNMGRTDDLTQTDLLITQPFSLGRYTLEANLNILNLFDEDTVNRIGNNHYIEDICEDVLADTCDNTVDFFFANAPFDSNAIMEAGGAQVRSSFGRPLGFQAPRSVRFGVKFIF